MSLALLTPTAAVTSHPSGIILVRCADYVAGGATTVSDGASISGTVVSETQTAAVQTTFASQSTMYGSRADTISIPRVDLPIDTSALNYSVFIAARVLGDVPSNAKGGTDWEKVSRSGASYGFGWGKNTGYIDGPTALARSRFDEYLIYDCADLSGFTFTSLKVRGWGITGGTLELRFDVIYLVPFLFGPDFNQTIENSGRFGLPLGFSTNGTLTVDQDDDASNWIGSHSVMSWNFPWMQDGADDVQGNNDEPTTLVDGFGDWTDEDAPRSHLAFIAGGTKPPASETIITEAFGYADSVGSVDTSQNWTVDGYYGSFGPSSIDNIYIDPGDFSSWRGWVIRSGLPTCYFGANEGITEDPRPDLAFGEARIDWGRDDGSASSDPRDYLEILAGMHEVVVEGAWRFDVLQQSYGFVGFDSDAGSEFVRVGGCAEIDSSGNVKVSVRLISRNTRPSPIEEIMDEATALTGVTTSDIVRVKAERRGFTWRAKAWLDGDTEPGWQVEGVEPIVSLSSGGVHQMVSHPWDTNWAADVDNDTVKYDPRQQIGSAPTFFPVAVAAVGVGVSQTKIDLSEFIVSFDPGSGTASDVSVEVRKYDGATVLDSAVALPWGSHRFVAGPSKTRRFNLDTDAFQIWAWKSGGGPDTMFASVGYIWELRDYTPAVAFIPQIYRRTVSG
jgi:hypothetical protein